MDYFGTVVNRAARVGHVGHGGQVVISETTFAQVQNQLDNAVISDLGAIPLKGLDRPETLRQISPTKLSQRRFPALNAPT